MKQRVLVVTTCIAVTLLLFSTISLASMLIPGSQVEINHEHDVSDVIVEHDLVVHVMEEEFVASWAPDDNHHEDPSIKGLVVGLDSIGSLGRAFVKFNFGNIPDEVSFSEAKLRTYLIVDRPTDDEDTPIGAYYCGNDSWNEMSITWNNQPQFSTSPSSVIDNPSSPDMFQENSWYEWDITDEVRTTLNGDKILSLVLRNVDETNPLDTGKIFAEEEDYPLNSPYLVLHCNTPTIENLAVDGFEDFPLLDYIQNPNPLFSWTTLDIDYLDSQYDYQIEVSENDEILWHSKNTDIIAVLDNGTSTSTHPFGTMNEMRFQFKFMNSLLDHSGIIDRLYFGVNSTDGAVVFDNFVISLANTVEPGTLGFNFKSNIGSSKFIEVLRADSYDAPIINGSVVFDIENTFILNPNMNLVIEIRFTTSSTSTLEAYYSPTPEFGSVAFSWGPAAYTSSTATTREDYAYDIEIEFSTEDILIADDSENPTTTFELTSNSTGTLQMKYDMNNFSQSGYVDRVNFQTNSSDQDIIFENLTVTLAETTVQGRLNHDQLETNYISDSAKVVLERDRYTLLNYDGFIILDIENSFFYTGINDLLIELHWDSISGDIGLYTLNNTGGYSAWSFENSIPEDGNATWAYCISMDFIRNESTSIYEGSPLSSGNDYSWRIRVTDSAGIWSDWMSQMFRFNPIDSVPEWDNLVVNPSPVPLGREVEVSINVTYFLGMNEVVIEYDGSSHTMLNSGDRYSHSWTPSMQGTMNFTIYMESSIGTVSIAESSFLVTSGIDIVLLVIIGGGVAVVLVIIVVFMKKKRSSK